MPMPRYYPLFLDISRSKCLVVGAGSVGRRKIGSLLEAGVRELLVLDPELTEPGCLPEHPALAFEARCFAPEDLAGCALVFAASASRETNAAVAAACAAQRIFCNCADAPQEGNALVPATARSGEMTLALSTGGASPAYARLLREELENWLHEKAPLATLLGRIRPRLLALEMDTMLNSKLLRALVRSGLGAALAAGDAEQCKKLLVAMLPEDLHPWIGEFLDGLV